MSSEEQGLATRSDNGHSLDDIVYCKRCQIADDVGGLPSHVACALARALTGYASLGMHGSSRHDLESNASSIRGAKEGRRWLVRETYKDHSSLPHVV